MGILDARARRLATGAGLALFVAACAGEQEPGQAAAREAELTRLRHAMVEEQIRARGVRDERVLAALRRVERHRFVPEADAAESYGDHPLAIGHGQTISQPYIVATMTELAHVDPGDRVLEIGTGSGYQAAVLADLGADVYTIEIVPELGEGAARVLAELGYQRVHARVGDGYAGWPEAAPFQAVIVTAAPPAIPQPLIDQLADGGRLVIPVGDRVQELRVLTRRGEDVVEETVFPVRFVPMTGKAREGD